LNNLVSTEYAKYQKLFQEKKRLQNLSKHQSWNYEIFLEKEQTLKFMLTYRLIEQQLMKLQKYLNKNLEKDYIWLSTSSAEYSILFISKKNEKLRLCVNYRQLNNIIKKNQYSLSLIEKIQNRFQRIKWFISLDVQDAYYRIQMKKNKKWKTAFHTQFELYEYLIMLFKLINASATF
jgi:hypothetical protein